MTVKLNVLGQTYDDALPCFMHIGVFYFNRVDGKHYEKLAMDTWLTENGKKFATGEVGDWPKAYTDANLPHLDLSKVNPASTTLSGGGGAAVPSLPAGGATTATVAGTGSASATITIANVPAADGTVTIAANAGADIDGISPVAFTSGQSLADIATAIATELNGKADSGTTVELAATSSGGVVTVTEAGGGDIDTLTAVVA